MSTIEHAGDLPAWAALVVSFFLIVGSGLALKKPKLILFSSERKL